MFGVTDRRIRQLVQKKIIPNVGRGMFDLGPTVQAYIRYLQGLSNGAISADTSELSQRLLQAQTLEKEAKARKAQLETGVIEGQLLKLDDVSHQWMSRFVEIKAAMLELPKRVAFRFTNPDVRLNVEEEVVAFVTELLTRYSREGICPDSPVGSEDTTKGALPSSGNNGKRMGKRKQSSRRKVVAASGAVANAQDALSEGTDERVQDAAH